MDKETEKVARQQRPYKDLVKSQGWKMAKTDLEEMMLLNSSITSIDAKEPNAAFQEMHGRMMAVQLVREWIEEVEGKADMYKQNIEEPEEQEKLEIIKRLN